jgi:hypothetical protein
MYTKACIRTGVKRRRRAPDTARSPREEGEGSVAETDVSDQQLTAEDLAVVNDGFESAPASAVIRWAIESFGDSLVLAASFEDIVLIDLVTKVAPAKSSSWTQRHTFPRRCPSSTICVSATGSISP